jgi:hypothetical protein
MDAFVGKAVKRLLDIHMKKDYSLIGDCVDLEYFEGVGRQYLKDVSGDLLDRIARLALIQSKKDAAARRRNERTAQAVPSLQEEWRSSREERAGKIAKRLCEIATRKNKRGQGFSLSSLAKDRYPKLWNSDPELVIDAILKAKKLWVTLDPGNLV